MFFLNNSNNRSFGLNSLILNNNSWGHLIPIAEVGINIGKRLLENEVIKEIGSETVEAGLDMINKIADDVLTDKKGLQKSATDNFKDFKEKVRKSITKKRKSQPTDLEEKIAKKQKTFNLLD